MAIPFPQHSYQVAKNSGSNFYLSFGILPADQKAAMYTAYAFSRLVDDAVDQDAPLIKKETDINMWLAELKGAYNGGAGHPVFQELACVVDHFQIPQQYFLDLIDGMKMDLTKTRYETFTELHKYCYHVAGTVGLICNTIFGQSHGPAHQYALDLGTAFQLTNIIRDVGSDADQGRIYLPQDELKQFNYDEQLLLDKMYTPTYYQLMKFQWERAQSYFDKAHQLLSKKERRSLVAAEIMDGIYYGIFKKIRKQQFHVFEKKIGLSKGRKLAILAKVWLLSKFA